MMDHILQLNRGDALANGTALHTPTTSCFSNLVPRRHARVRLVHNPFCLGETGLQHDTKEGISQG